MAQPAPFETLGVFYLGRVYDADRGAATDELVLYDSRDLTTHGVLGRFWVASG